MTFKANSVTRFGKISPLWHNFKSLGEIFQGLFSIWQNFDPTVGKMFYIWVSFECCRWPNILTQFKHLVTLFISPFVLYIGAYIEQDISTNKYCSSTFYASKTIPSFTCKWINCSKRLFIGNKMVQGRQLFAPFRFRKFCKMLLSSGADCIHTNLSIA